MGHFLSKSYIYNENSKACWLEKSVFIEIFRFSRFITQLNQGNKEINFRTYIYTYIINVQTGNPINNTKNT